MKKKHSFFDEGEEAYKIEAFVSFGVTRLSYFLLEGHWEMMHVVMVRFLSSLQ